MSGFFTNKIKLGMIIRQAIYKWRFMLTALAIRELFCPVYTNSWMASLAVNSRYA